MGQLIRDSASNKRLKVASHLENRRALYKSAKGGPRACDVECGADMTQLILGAVLGAIISAILSVSITAAVEYERQPKLRLSIEYPPFDARYPNDRPAREARYLRLLVSNEATTKGWQKWIMRLPAIQCRGEITFHHLDGQNISGRVMAGRWAGSPQPLTIPVVGPNGVVFEIVDLTRLTIESRIDIQPGEGTALDIAVRLDEDADCYGWNNEAYFDRNALWRSPHWRIPPGRYLVRAVVISAGHRWQLITRLINDVPRSDFRLEPASEDDLSRFPL